MGSHRLARRNQQGVRACVRAAGKALEENDRQTDNDRQMLVSSIIVRLSRKRKCFGRGGEGGTTISKPTYPSVVMVTMVYQNASGMLVKVVSGSLFSV